MKFALKLLHKCVQIIIYTWICRFYVCIVVICTYSVVSGWHYSTCSSTEVVPAAVRCDTSVRHCRTWRGRSNSGSTSTETTPTPPRRRKSCWPSAHKWPWSRWVHSIARLSQLSAGQVLKKKWYRIRRENSSSSCEWSEGKKIDFCGWVSV